MNWTIENFGKYRENITFPQLLFRDPDYFFHKMRNGGFDPHIQAHADYIYARATSIKIPVVNGIEMAAHYQTQTVRRRVKFAGLFFIRKNAPDEPYLSNMIVRDVIDMSLPYTFSRYNKSGYRHMVRQIKMIYFGNESHYMTRKRCEEFFDVDSHFV